MKEDKKDAVPCSHGLMRMNAKGVLEERIRREQKVVDGLVVLLQSVEWDALTQEQDEKLWTLLTRTGGI